MLQQCLTVKYPSPPQAREPLANLIVVTGHNDHSSEYLWNQKEMTNYLSVWPRPSKPIVGKAQHKPTACGHWVNSFRSYKGAATSLPVYLPLLRLINTLQHCLSPYEGNQQSLPGWQHAALHIQLRPEVMVENSKCLICLPLMLGFTQQKASVC